MPHTTDTDGALFEQLRPRLQAISRRIVGSEAEAEDIVQDCFLKWQDAEQAALATPAAWLTTVVRHQSIDCLRQRARATLAARAALELVPDMAPAPPEQGLLRRAELGEALARLLACLSPSERMALILHEVFERDHADIAAALGTNAVNARQYLARARRRLREDQAEAPAGDKLCRELIRRFQAAINGLDMPAMVSLLGEEQPVAVRESPRLPVRAGACANDASYGMILAA
ncbi:sigma-70 family RNA polymerase sigma factor [Massilia sp. P8910]|uniref:sigma-70 family RNA polymerase sigma factor n=1 Tax=Massilia antarctica TaxID=2765360 RepID=UPI0006BB77A7|nr:MULTISPECIES: sigma-70 family RNA polymerase sigma factor [Massilia]MCE3605658.1 sigma-70 family RNA polymerase sigma factor [Massilia antarctica]MCY0911349.1 sigma-70 family RNA polymerase sigma factor [Massilia sp. H27-R4]CUI05048.1 RNA polymerase sigma-70 factor [Janthinobacterium sp. CG23_2]CUU28834.1 RNA polymerase sigma-70 factor [Janthinobacterium sp. CG23_2]